MLVALAITSRDASAGRIAASAEKVRILPPPATELIAAATRVTPAINVNDASVEDNSVTKKQKATEIIRLVPLCFRWGLRERLKFRSQSMYSRPRRRGVLHLEESQNLLF